MKKGYWISLYVKVENQDNLKKYAETLTPIIKSYGGKPLVRGGKYETFDGDNFIRTVVWEMNIILLATKIAPSFIYPNSPTILQSPHLTIPHSKGFLTEMKEMKPRTITQGVLET